MKTFLLVIITLCMMVTCFNINDLRSAYVKGPSVLGVVSENIVSILENE